MSQELLVNVPAQLRALKLATDLLVAPAEMWQPTLVDWAPELNVTKDLVSTTPGATSPGAALTFNNKGGVLVGFHVHNAAGTDTVRLRQLLIDIDGAGLDVFTVLNYQSVVLNGRQAGFEMYLNMPFTTSLLLRGLSSTTGAGTLSVQPIVRAVK